MVERNGKKSEKGGALTLNFHQQPPEFPFLNVFFDLTIFLQEIGTGEPKCGSDLPIELSLFYDGMPRVMVPKECVEVEEPEKLYIRSDTGCCKARVKITLCSMDLENRSFLICATAPQKKSDVVEAFSTPFKVMRYRLLVQDDAAWEDPWYKDEGGREKCIELKVKLVDFDNKLVKSRRVPLRVTLLYADSLLPVTDQTILKVFGPAGVFSGGGNNNNNSSVQDSDPGVVVEQGVATVKVRIEDVSKNHQNQNFRVKIAPDTLNSPTDCDISHDLSKPVAVKSKRNKKRNRKPPNESSGSSVKRHSANVPPTTAHSHPSELDFIEFATRQQQQQQQQQQQPPPGNLFTGFPPPSLHHQRNSALFDDLGDGAAGSTRQALRVALGWCAHVVDTLQQHVMWKQQGYSTNRDGSPDQTQPLYVITNPNSYIEELLQSYEKSVKPCVETLEAADEGGEDGGDRDQLQDTAGSGPSSSKRQRLDFDDPKRNGHRPKFANDTQEEEDDDEDDDEDMIPGGEMRRLRPPELSRPRNSINAVVDALRGTIGTGTTGEERSNEEDDTFGDEPSMPSKSRSLSALARPVMSRGVSSLITGGDSLQFDRPTSVSRPVDLTEKAVRVVLAKRLKLPRSKTPLGFPAFDSEKRFVGLFQDIEVGQQHTQIVFVSADDPELELTERDRELATAAFNREVENASDCVKDISVHGSLEKLKESVAIYHWSKEAFSNEIDLPEKSGESSKENAASTSAPAAAATVTTEA